MRKAKRLGMTAAFVAWISLVAYPALLQHRNRSMPCPTQPNLSQPSLFFPLRGAWSLPDSPMVEILPPNPPLTPKPGEIAHGAAGRTRR